MLGRAAIRQTDPDYFPLAVASYILGGGASSRLYGRVRDEGGLAYSVWSDLGPARYGALLVVGAQSRTAAVPKVIDLLREEMARLAREPVQAAELDLARSYLIGSFPLRLDTSAKVASFITSVEAEGLGLDYAERYRQEIAKVTASDVQRVSARFLAPDAFNRVVVGRRSREALPGGGGRSREAPPRAGRGAARGGPGGGGDVRPRRAGDRPGARGGTAQHDERRALRRRVAGHQRRRRRGRRRHALLPPGPRRAARRLQDRVPHPRRPRQASPGAAGPAAHVGAAQGRPRGFRRATTFRGSS